MAHLQEFDTSNSFSAKVVKTTRITPETSDEEVRDIVFAFENGAADFKAGQSVGVLVPGPHEFGQKQYLRLYTIADTPEAEKISKKINICVRRCFYIDDFSGERYKGIASNYLCDLQPGAAVTLCGPYGLPFDVPDDKSANILMIALGTGIAPFRAFVRHIYETQGGWDGKVRLFYGARSGLDLLYMNDKKNDLSQYFDDETFKAFEAVSPRPYLDAPVALDQALEKHAEEVWQMVLEADTHVYIAGLEKIRPMLDKAFAKMAGSAEKWERRRAEMMAGKRWIELLY